MGKHRWNWNKNIRSDKFTHSVNFVRGGNPLNVVRGVGKTGHGTKKWSVNARVGGMKTLGEPMPATDRISGPPASTASNQGGVCPFFTAAVTQVDVPPSRPPHPAPRLSLSTSICALSAKRALAFKCALSSIDNLQKIRKFVGCFVSRKAWPRPNVPRVERSISSPTENSRITFIFTYFF